MVEMVSKIFECFIGEETIFRLEIAPFDSVSPRSAGQTNFVDSVCFIRNRFVNIESSRVTFTVSELNGFIKQLAS